MMKRISAFLLLLALILQLGSCIQVIDAPNRVSDEQNGGSVTDKGLLPSAPTQPVLPDWKGAEDTAEDFLAMQNAIVDCSEREYSYAEMIEDLKQLAATYPEHFSYRTFGKSVAGRDLYVATLGNPDAEKQILVSAGIHGREYLTPLLVMKQMEFYLAYYDIGTCGDVSYSTLFEEYCFYVVPMTNPDGIMLAEEGISSVSDQELYNKIYSAYYTDYKNFYTQQTDINEYLKIWKGNANAVDLNRNFDALWSQIDTGMYRPSHKNYKGAEAASEPETRAMVELTDSLSNIQAVLCIHSQGEVLYWDCGQDDELRQATRDFTKMISDRNGYRIIDEQNNDASYSDWCALERGLIAVTVETGIGSCPLEISQFATIWSDNFDLFVLSARYFE